MWPQTGEPLESTTSSLVAKSWKAIKWQCYTINVVTRYIWKLPECTTDNYNKDTLSVVRWRKSWILGWDYDLVTERIIWRIYYRNWIKIFIAVTFGCRITYNNHHIWTERLSEFEIAWRRVPFWRKRQHRNSGLSIPYRRLIFKLIIWPLQRFHDPCWDIRMLFIMRLQVIIGIRNDTPAGSF